jgi:hypothetical protein
MHLGNIPNDAARRTLGMAVAAEKFGSRLFSNSAAPSQVARQARPKKATENYRIDWPF